MVGPDGFWGQSLEEGRQSLDTHLRRLWCCEIVVVVKDMKVSELPLLRQLN
jgi:hypothetical protein